MKDVWVALIITGAILVLTIAGSEAGVIVAFLGVLGLVFEQGHK